MRSGLTIATVLILAIVAMSGVDYAEYHLAIPIEGVFTPCYNGPFSFNDTAGLTNHTTKILQLDPGSKGYLCLDYRFQGAVPANYTPGIGITSTTSSGGTFSARGCGSNNVSAVVECPGIHISFHTARLFSPPSSFVAGVNITTDPTVREGVYWLWFGQPCTLVVLYIGPPPVRLSGVQVGGAISCVMVSPAPTVRIAGILGLRVETVSVG